MTGAVWAEVNVIAALRAGLEKFQFEQFRKGNEKW